MNLDVNRICLKCGKKIQKPRGASSNLSKIVVLIFGKGEPNEYPYAHGSDPYAVPAAKVFEKDPDPKTFHVVLERGKKPNKAVLCEDCAKELGLYELRDAAL